MSRIEEALKRAQGGGEPTAVAELDSGGLTVDRYEPERAWELAAHSPEPQPLPAPAVASTARPMRDARLEGKLVISRTARRLAVEQYRRLAATLHEGQVDREIRTVMITSAAPSEGKSLTVMNLALTLSGSYRRRVLLIDADLRSPSLHEFFGLDNVNGLSDGLRSHDATVSPIAVSPYLSVLPAGRPDPNPLASLTSERMQAMIRQAASSYQWVLVDAPPVSLLPDAHHLARLVDGVLLVIAAHATPYAVIDRTVTELDPDRILGVVLNRAADTAIPAARFHGGSR